MQMHRHLLITCALSALFVAPALAQTTSGSGSKSSTPGSATSPSMSDKQDTTTQGQSSKPGMSSSERGTSTSREMSSGDKSSGMSSSGSMSRSSDMGGQKQKLSSSQVRRIQQALKAQGHDPGPIDGVMGAKTKEAIRAFQDSQNITATGQIDQETMEKLGVGRTSARQ